MKCYAITFQVVIEESAKYGDFVSHGFILPGGYTRTIPDGLCGPEFSAWRKDMGCDTPLSADDWDGEQTDHAECRAAAKMILDGGFTFELGCQDWYPSEPEQDMYTGEETTKAFHLTGDWTAEEEGIVMRLVKAGDADSPL